MGKRKRIEWEEALPLLHDLNTNNNASNWWFERFEIWRRGKSWGNPRKWERRSDLRMIMREKARKLNIVMVWLNTKWREEMEAVKWWIETEREMCIENVPLPSHLWRELFPPKKSNLNFRSYFHFISFLLF